MGTSEMPTLPMAGCSSPSLSASCKDVRPLLSLSLPSSLSLYLSLLTFISFSLFSWRFHLHSDPQVSMFHVRFQKSWTTGSTDILSLSVRYSSVYCNSHNTYLSIRHKKFSCSVEFSVCVVYDPNAMAAI